MIGNTLSVILIVLGSLFNRARQPCCLMQYVNKRRRK